MDTVSFMNKISPSVDVMYDNIQGHCIYIMLGVGAMVMIIRC